MEKGVESNSGGVRMLALKPGRAQLWTGSKESVSVSSLASFSS